MFGIFSRKLPQDMTIPKGVFFPYVGKELYGPNWNATKLALQQDFFKEHFEYWSHLITIGKVSGAGPYSKWDGALIVFSKEVTSYDEAVSLMSGDPWARRGIVIHTVQQWLEGTAASV